MCLETNATRTWNRALNYFGSKDLDRALYAFEMIPRTPKIYFNLSMVHVALGDLISAVDCLQMATTSSSASAVEYFQLGVLLFSLEDYEQSYKNFSIAYLSMAGQSQLSFKHVGLDTCLNSFEILFNCAMCLLHMGNFEEGKEKLIDAQDQQEYATQTRSSFDVFSIPLTNEGSEKGEFIAKEGYWRVFQIPSGTLYRPINQSSNEYQQAINKPDSIKTNPSISDQSSSSDQPHRSLHSPFLKLFKLSKKKSRNFFK